MRRLTHKVWLLAIPLLGLIPGLWGVFFPAQSSYSDLVISHLPNALWIQTSLSTMGEIPLWSRLILSGYPFSANPLSGLFYFPSWWGLLFPQPAGLYLVTAFHLFLGGVGMVKFLEEKHLPYPAAIFGGLLFQTMPRLWAHFLAGHITLVFALCWMPWLFWAVDRSIRVKGRIIGLSALFWGLIALADLRMVLPVGLAWGGYVLFRVLIAEKCWKDLFRFILEGTGGLLLAASVWLPLSEYTRLSTRALMSTSENLVFSFPLDHLWGLFIPDLGGSPEWVIYPGAVVLVLLPLASWKRKENVFWWILSITGIVFALGDTVPGLGELYHWLGLGVLRVPARMLLITQFSWILLGSLTVSQWLEVPPRIAPSMKLAGVAVTTFLLLLAFGTGVMTGEWIPRLWTGSVSFFLAYVWLRILVAKGFSFKNSMSIFWGVPLLCNLLVIAFGAKILPAGEVLAQNAEVARWLTAQKREMGNFRTYSPSYSLPQQTAALYGIELADGVDPLILASYQQFMEKATGVPSRGYSVTLPPFETGEPALDNRFYKPDFQQLALVGVKYVLADFDLVGAETNLVTTIGSTRVYQNPFFVGMAWLEQGQETIPVSEVVYTANTLEVRRVGQGRLVFAELDYPGWRAFVDGKPVEITPAYGILRSVLIPAGTHQVRMEYHPQKVYWGILVSVLSWGGLAVLWFKQKRVDD